MPTPTYESTGLPLFNNNFGGGVETPMLRTEMQSGRTRQQQEFSTELDKFNVEVLLTTEEYATFKTFWRDTLKGGSLSFLITLPVGDEDFEEMLVKFDGKYQYRYQPHRHWLISGTLERETTQEIADPSFSPFPLWYRPEITLIGDIEANPLTHNNALFKSNPGTGNNYEVTVPNPVEVSDQLQVAVRLTGPGSVTIKTEGEEGGGGDPGPGDPPDWAAIASAMTGLVSYYDMGEAETDGGGISTLIDGFSTHDLAHGNLTATDYVQASKVGNYLSLNGLQVFNPADAIHPANLHRWHVFYVWQPQLLSLNGATYTQWLQGGNGFNSQKRPSLEVQVLYENAHRFTTELGIGNDLSYFYSSIPSLLLPTGKLQVTEWRVEGGGNAISKAWNNGFYLGEYDTGGAHAGNDQKWVPCMGTSRRYGGIPGNQFFRVRAILFFNSSLSLVDAATMREALMQNFNDVNAYA